MVSKISMALVMFAMVGCGTNENGSSLDDVNSFLKGPTAGFTSQVKSYRISQYNVKGGNIKSLVDAKTLLAVSIKDIKLIKNAGGSISYAQGASEFGVIPASLLEFIDKNEGYGADGDMRCGDVQQGFDIRVAVLLAKLYQELSGGQGEAHLDKFWEDGFHIARAWKKRLCGDKYNPSYWESSKERPAKRDDPDTIVPQGTVVTTGEEKVQTPSTTSTDTSSDTPASTPAASSASCYGTSGTLEFAEGARWPTEPNLVCEKGNWIWR